MSNWIDVKDRLPEIHEYAPGSGTGISDPVLVYLDDVHNNESRVEVWYFRRGGQGDTTSTYWDWDSPRVTHWQPVPPPPVVGRAPDVSGFVFPPMPLAVFRHDKVGPLFDRLSMQFYAASCMRLDAALKAATKISDEAVQAFHDEYPLSCIAPYDWPTHMIEKVKAAIAAARKA